MNAPFYHWLLGLVVVLWCCSDIRAQPAMESLRRGELALEKGEAEHAFQWMAGAMRQARVDKQTTVFLRAANGIARLGLDRQVSMDSAFLLAQEASRAVAFSARDTSLATLYYHLARFHHYHARFDKSAPHADDAIHFFNQASTIYTTVEGTESLQAAKCYHGLADVYKYTIFNFQLAEEYYERALGIREKRHLSDTITLFNNYYGLAATNRSQRDYEKAVAYATVAITLSKSLNTVRQEIANSMVANVYRDMGNTVEAIRSYQEALRLNEIADTRMKRGTHYRATHYQNIGEAMFRDSLYDDALHYYGLAERIYRSQKVDDERLFLQMLNQKAKVYSRKGDATRFEAAIEDVFAGLKRLGKSRSKEAAETYLLIAEHYASQEKYYSAVDQCQLALVALIPAFTSLDAKHNPTVTMIGTSFFAGEVLARKGEYLSRLHRATKRSAYLEEALTCLYLAEQLLSEERNTLDTEDAKWAYLGTKYAVYESIIASLYESWFGANDAQALTQAYQFFERSKARSLSDALAAAEQARSIGADDSLLRVHGTLKTEELMTENRINEMAAIGNRQAEISRLRAQLVTIDRKLQRCTEEIEDKYPGYFNAKYGQTLNPLPDVQSMARAEGRVILEYFWGSEWIYGLGISADTVVFRRIGRTDSIRRTINQLLVHLHDEHSSANAGIFKLFVTSAHTLYKALIGPFENLMGTASLQIIPDGYINLVPFDILVQQMPKNGSVNYRNLSYLLKSRAIGYAYSTSMLRNIDRRTVSRPSLLAVGFTGGQRQRASENDMRELEDIEGAEKELDALAARFRNGRFLREREATEHNFKSLSPGYDIIHLAIHGRGDRSSNFSASLFFRSRPDTVDDGIFHAYELYGPKLKALMAVLSACESGIGKDYRGEGMISMASAFTSAGCKNTLMSLWKVNDQTSISLMDYFYQQLQSGLPIDEALRRAKLDYLEQSDELTADPKTWAPLVAYGSLHQVFEKDRRHPLLILVLAIGGLLVGAGVYWFRRRR